MDDKCKKNDQKGELETHEKYLDYRYHTDQISSGLMRAEETNIHYLLNWADDTSFEKGSSQIPNFPQFPMNSCMGGKEESFPPTHMKKLLQLQGASSNGFMKMIAIIEP